METTEYLRALVDSGISTVLAGVVIYWFRSDSKERLTHEKQRAREAQALARQEREDKMLLISTIQKNTEAMTKLIRIIDDKVGGAS